MAERVLEYQHTIEPKNRVESFFQLLYGSNMKFFAKRGNSLTKTRIEKYDLNRQWIFVGSRERMKSVATQSTLFAVVADANVETTFFTPNGYYRRDLRLTDSLRWLNAYVFDFDTPGDSIQDIFDRIERAGLPMPTAVIQTPSGGYHAYFMFSEPVRATPRAIRLYTAIMSHIAEDIGSDRAAVGANRIFRTPLENNLVFFEPNNRFNFDVFKEWREINNPLDSKNLGFINVETKHVMNHPALQHLLGTNCKEGNREKTAFTLALAMKASEWEQCAAEDALSKWFEDCCEKGTQAGKKRFTKREALYKAKIVYSKTSLHAPAAEVVRELSGQPFYYSSRSHWEAAKPRSERERNHLSEWKEDLLKMLRDRVELAGTQQELATQLNCPLASFKLIVKQLKEQGIVVVEATRGRGGSTFIKLPDEVEVEVCGKTSEADIDNKEQLDKENQESKVIYVDFVLRKIKKSRNHIQLIRSEEESDPGPPI